jgi:hypothetical protein
MLLFNNLKQNQVRRDIFSSSRNFNNYFLRTFMRRIGCVFLLAGLSSWIGGTISIFNMARRIQFFPQGIAICIYGSLFLRLRLRLFLRILWNVGSGFNEFDIEKGLVHIFRVGFPGKNRYFESFYSFSDLASIYVEVRTCLAKPSGVNLYLVLKDRQLILLTPLGETGYYSNNEIECFSSYLAKFLNLPLEKLLKSFMIYPNFSPYDYLLN